MCAYGYKDAKGIINVASNRLIMTENYLEKTHQLSSVSHQDHRTRAGEVSITNPAKPFAARLRPGQAAQSAGLRLPERSHHSQYGEDFYGVLEQLAENYFAAKDKF